MLCSDPKLDYVAVLSRIELRGHSRILESRIAQQGCDLSWHPCPKRELRLPKTRTQKRNSVFACGKCANIIKRHQKGLKSGSDFGRFSRNLAFSPSEFSLSSNSQQNGGKQALGNFSTSCADFELAGAADQQAGITRNNNNRAELCITPKSKQRFSSTVRLFVRGNVFSSTFQLSNRPAWVVVATLS